MAIAMGLRAQQQKPKPEEDGSISQRGATGAQAASNEINSTPAVADYASVSTANEAGNVGDITTSMSVGVTVGAVSADTSSTNKNSALSATSTISGKSQPPSSSEQVHSQRPYHADQRQQVLRQQQQTTCI